MTDVVNPRPQIPDSRSKKIIAAIIPAYNEANHITEVLAAIKKASVLKKILIVDDGSADNTADIVKKEGFEVLQLEKNGGKGAAMQAGLEQVKADVYLFIDADLVGLRESHIESLINPLLEDKGLSMTIGKFKGGRKSTDWAQSIMPQISGQRAITKEFARSLPDLSKAGFGVEILITKFAKKNGFKSKEVILPSMTQVMKEEKLGFGKGFASRLKMYAHMFRSYLR